LHNRATEGEFAAMCAAERSQMGAGGVVHSFDGDVAELKELLGLGLNGCSKTSMSPRARVPLDRLHPETNAPWCGIKRKHAEEKKKKWRPCAMVKDRCEPYHIEQVLQRSAGRSRRGGGGGGRRCGL